ncbi:MAG: hypothetical protein ABIM74_01620 [candidate division WOR-3 bacterium]
MRIREFKTAVENFRVGVPGLVGLFIFDRHRSLLLYGGSDDIASSLGEISFCYARLARSLEKANACRKDMGAIKRIDIVAKRMTVSASLISDEHIVIGECVGQKGLGVLVHGIPFLGKIMRRFKDER